MTYEPSFRTRAVMPDPIDEEAHQLQVEELRTKLSDLAETQEAFYSKGWPHIVARLNDEIDLGQRAILSGEFEDDPRKSAHVRGQVSACKLLLDMPARVAQEIEMTERELEPERP